MTVVQLRDRLITEGIASVQKHETQPARIRGGLAGFELCRTLNTPEDYQRVLEERALHERDMRRPDVDTDAYWEYRMATEQVEFIWKHLKALWGIGSTQSANAILHLAEMLIRSNCCSAPVKVDGDDREGTHFYACTACGRACDVHEAAA